MKLAPITVAARTKYGLSPTLTGALITQVKPDSEASYLGVVPGDVIIAVRETPIATPDDVHKAFKEAMAQDRRTCRAHPDQERRAVGSNIRQRQEVLVS